MRICLYLGIFGFLTNISLGVAGITFVRFCASQQGLGFKRGHPILFIGPTLLIMAASPAGDALSLDSLLWWLQFSTIHSRMGGRLSGRLFGSRSGSGKGQPRFFHSLLQGMRTSCNLTCHRYGLPFAAIAVYLGLTYLSAGWQKAMAGTYKFFSWGYSDVLLLEMQNGWAKHLGKAYVPTLAQAEWNPLQVLFYSYLQPIIRIDRVPVLMHLSSHFCMLWECTHGLLLLASEPVRLAAIAIAISFHVLVAWIIGIPQFMGLATVHLIFLPWDKILAWALGKVRRSRLAAGQQWIKLADDMETPLPMKDDDLEESEQTRLESTDLYNLANSLSFGRSIAATLVVGLLVAGFQGRWTLHPRPDDCVPFDAYPGFGTVTPLRFWSHGVYGPGRVPALIRSRRVIATYWNGTVVEKGIMQVFCEMEGHSPCMISADLYLNSRKHHDEFLAFRQGTLFPFLGSKELPIPGRHDFWALTTLIAAHPGVLGSKADIAYLSFVSNTTVWVDFNKPFDSLPQQQPICNIVVRADRHGHREMPGVPPICSNKAQQSLPVLDLDFTLATCNMPLPTDQTVKDKMCQQWGTDHN